MIMLFISIIAIIAAGTIAFSYFSCKHDNSVKHCQGIYCPDCDSYLQENDD